MGIDKETKPQYINIVIEPKNKKYLDDLRSQAQEEGQNDNRDKDLPRALTLNLEGHSFKMDEYYFECSGMTSDMPQLTISGQALGNNGNYYFSININLSDTILLDILQHSIGRLNKLKTAMEVLK